MGDWKTFKVQDIASSQKNALVGGPFGSNLVTSDYVNFGVPVIRGQNMGQGRWVSGNFAFVTNEKAQSLKANMAKPGDLVFTQRGTLGQVAIIPTGEFEEYLISQSQMKLTVDKQKTDVLYLYYVFCSEDQLAYIRQNSIQTGVPHTNLTTLRNTPLSLPKLSEQKAIAKILSSLDDKIELNRRMNATLEAMARALFKAWFVDFEPVTANLENRPSTSASPEIAKLFPSDFENGIPKGWQINKMAECIEVGIGKTPPRKEPQWFSEDTSNVRWVSIRNMGATGMYTRETSEYLTADAVKKFNVRIVPDNTVLLSFKLTVGRVCITDGECTTNEAIAHFVRREQSKLNPYYLYLYLRAFDYSSLGSTSSIATAVNSKSIRDMPILTPQGPILDEFEKIIQPIFEKIKTNQREIETLGEIRDSLLPRLISGKLRVGDFETEIVQSV